jgi:myo-inositol-1(or 4)-monophosphatase
MQLRRKSRPRTEFAVFAEGLARLAGTVIKSNFSPQMRKEWKRDGTPLTVSDTKINSLVIEEIRREFPKHSILAEEESALFPGSEFVWVCDPIDGTIPFSHGVPTSAFSLALCRNGVPLSGVLFDPFLDRMLIAELGSGTFLNGERVRVSPAKSLERNLVGIEGPNSDLFSKSKTIEGAVMQGITPVILQSVCYAGMLVAIGEFVGVVFSGRTPWDAAALKIIVDEAGGKSTSIKGDSQSYTEPINGLVCSNGLLHNELLALVGHVEN